MIFFVPFPFSYLSFSLSCSTFPTYLMILPWFLFAVWIGISFSLPLFKTKNRRIFFSLIGSIVFAIDIISSVVLNIIDSRSNDGNNEDNRSFEIASDAIFSVLYIGVSILMIIEGISMFRISLNPGILSMFKWKLWVLTISTFVLGAIFFVQFIYSILSICNDDFTIDGVRIMFERCLSDHCFSYFFVWTLKYSLVEVVPSLVFMIIFGLFSAKSVIPSQSQSQRMYPMQRIALGSISLSPSHSSLPQKTKMGQREKERKKRESHNHKKHGAQRKESGTIATERSTSEDEIRLLDDQPSRVDFSFDGSAEDASSMKNDSAYQNRLEDPIDFDAQQISVAVPKEARKKNR
eukprot:MONOS_4358.1-p1 / transcript=MONOS_4358.1 / gene=MONOS_4358 / organism=Monocercomonoides_exilis_PA203 / gene_product=unspecified product / transcript_product=unspecified product / location=Mono_scaffold00115:28526-29723(+) / protein_length=349 / sequence_SO=supercontig / SO=protein_coding / is_pseudo=false